MEKLRRDQSTTHSSDRSQRRLPILLIACFVGASVALPARAQYSGYGGYGYGAGSMMTYSMIRTVPMMGSMLVRGLMSHHGQSNKPKKVKNKNNNGQMSASNSTVQGQVYPGESGQSGYMMPGQANGASSGQSGFGNMPAQGFSGQGGQAYANAPGLSSGGQNGQNGYGAAPGRSGAPGQTAYGMQGAGGYPNSGQ